MKPNANQNLRFNIQRAACWLREWRMVRTLWLILFLSSVVAFAITTSEIVHDYPPLNQPTEAQAPQVAVVLGAKTTQNIMSHTLIARADEAIALYRSGAVQAIIFTGGYRDKNPALEHSESYLARAYAVQNGIPEGVIYIDERSVDTLSNLQQAKIIISQHSWNGVVVVSDRWHLARTRLMAQDLGMNVQLAPARGSVHRSHFSKSKFVLREVLKIWAYQLSKLLA